MYVKLTDESFIDTESGWNPTAGMSREISTLTKLEPNQLNKIQSRNVVCVRMESNGNSKLFPLVKF